MSDCTKLFWRAVRAKIKALFDFIMVQLAEENKDCVTYLKSIDIKN